MNGTESIPVAANADPAGPAPGARLAEARRAQNLTPADIARQMKLSVWQVEALEGGHYQQLPGPIFVRGFIRNYAKLVKLDPNELLGAAGDSLPRSVPSPERPPSQDIPFPARRQSRWPLLAFTAAVLVGVLVVYEFYWNEPEVKATQVAAVTPLQASPQPKRAEAPASQQSAGELHAAQPQPAMSMAAEPRAAQGKPSAGAAGAQPDQDRAPRPGERQVRLAFAEESWVEIRDRDERVIFSQLNRPGTRQFISGVPPFSIVVGNAHGVRMTYEDKPVDLASHTQIDVARLILQ